MLKSLFNWKVILNLVVAIGVFLGIVWLTFRWLEYHTTHGQEIPVPNVINKSVLEAVKILEDTGLEYEIDSNKYDPRYRPLQVLQVYPSAGSRVKSGRAIQMRVNPKTWAPVVVPDVINKYSGLGFQRIDQVGLKIGDTIYEPNIQKDAIIRLLHNGVVMKPGTLLPRFSILDVVIGSGPMRNIIVPNLVGLTVKEAKGIIAQNLFEVGLVEYEEGQEDENALVYYQDPAFGDARDQGMQVDLWASKRSPAEMGAKIAQLNAVYRMKIDTSLPPLQYEEVQIDTPPVAPAPVVQPKPEPKVSKETPPAKKEPTKKAEESPKKTEAKNSTIKKVDPTPTKKPEAKAPEVKPKVKKIIME